MINGYYVPAQSAIEGTINSEILYAVGTIVVAIATLIGAMGTYRSIKDRSQLRSYDELEEQLKLARDEFNEEIKNLSKAHREEIIARDNKHQEERDILDSRWREAFDNQDKSFNGKIRDLNTRLDAYYYEVKRFERVTMVSLKHIEQQDAAMLHHGITPLPLPIELEIFKRSELESGNDS